MKRITLLMVVLAAGVLACSSSPAAPTPRSLTVTCPTTNFNGPNLTSQCTATVAMSNGTTQDQTAGSQWRSSDSTIAGVSSSGLVTSLAPGSAVITATFQSVSGTITVTVSAIHPANRRQLRGR